MSADTLDERLRAARDEYRRLDGRRSDDHLPTAPPATGHRRRWRSAVLVGAVAAGLALVALVVWGGGADEQSVDLVGPGPIEAPAPSGPPAGEPSDAGAPTDGSDQPPRPDPTGAAGVVAVEDARIVVQPASGPYRDGQEVVVTIPAGFTADPWNEPPRLCAVVATTDGARETCDPLDPLGATLQRDPPDPETVRWSVTLSTVTFTPDGYRDCAEAEVTCRIVVRRADGTESASVPLDFVGPAVPRPITGRPGGPTLAVTPGAAPGSYRLDPEGLVVDPSDPAEEAVLYVRQCAFGVSDAADGPYGIEDLWGVHEWAVRPLGGPNCDALVWQTVRLDPSEPNAAVDVPLPREFYGYAGWSDCAVLSCYLEVRGGTIVGSVATPELTLAAAPLRVDETVARPPRPELVIVDPGPYRAGQTVTVALRNLPADFETGVGVCHVTAPWGCSYDFATWGVGDHEATFELPAHVAGCPPGECYLEIDAGSEGLPPVAVAELPIAE